MGPSLTTVAEIVLIADDEWMNREVLQIFFEQAGYQVMAAASGSQALAFARKTPPVLAVLDLRLGDVRGDEVCAAMKADPQTANSKVVLISAMNDTADAEAAQAAGADGYLSKTLDWPVIIQRSLALLGQTNP